MTCQFCGRAETLAAIWSQGPKFEASPGSSHDEGVSDNFLPEPNRMSGGGQGQSLLFNHFEPEEEQAE